MISDKITPKTEPIKIKVPFGIGEIIPLKGIEFLVMEIKEDALILRPRGFTKKRYKQLLRGNK